MLSSLTRRSAIKAMGAGTLAASFGNLWTGAALGEDAGPDSEPKGPLDYELPPLNYAYDGLEPQIDEQILRIHHGRHHNGYVNGLNSTLQKIEGAREKSDYSNIRALSRDLVFNCAGHVLHVLYWNSMTPGGSELPAGAFRNAIDRDFGSVEKLKQHFAAAAVGVEANGWGLLGFEPLGRRLMVLQVENHQKLTTWDFRPILTCDVWEHAYYLQYKNRRGEYVNRFMELIDWSAAAERYDKGMV